MSSRGFQSRGMRFGLGRLSVSRGLGPLEPMLEELELPEGLPSPNIKASKVNRSRPRIITVAKRKRG